LLPIAKGNFSVTGTVDLINGLKKRATLDDVKNTVKLNGSEMQRKMQRDAPVDTGFLKRSITLTTEENGFTAHVGTVAHYAPYLVYGTRFMYAQDFFRPNYYKQREQFKKDLERLMR